MPLSRAHKLLIASSVTLMTVLSVVDFTALFAATTPSKNPYDAMNVSGAVTLYHMKMNSFFNNKISLMMEKKGSMKGDCKDVKDVTTYCVAAQALDEYILYRDALVRKQDNPFDAGSAASKSTLRRFQKDYADALLIEKIGKLNLGGESLYSQADQRVLAEQHSARLRLINSEISSSKRTMDLMIAAYHELRMAYPMHLQLEELATNLGAYRDKLRAWRKQIESFPAKFHDATTTKCT